MIAILDHPLRARLEQHEVWQKLTKSQPWRNFLTGRKFFEVQMGQEWREAITALTEGGIYAGFDPSTGGTALIVRGRDATIMETFRSKLLELLRLGKPDTDSDQKEYRGVPVYRVEAGRTAVVGPWLVLVNKPEIGKEILDRLLDDDNQPRTIAGSSKESLAANAGFMAAVASRPKQLSVWGFADLEAIRQEEKVRKVLEGRAENPAAELIAGGIQSILLNTPYVTGELELPTSGIKLSIRMPSKSEWIPEHRSWFFGPDFSGTAPRLPVVPDTLLTLGTWRDASQMWLRAGDLFDENMNDQLANADSTLTTLFAGRDFGEDILGSFQPQIGFVMTRQDFDGVLPQPAIRLPAFALVLELREPERMTRELRRTFQSMIGFFNVLGAMERRAQLEMDMKKLPGAELIISSYVAEDGEKDSTSAPIIFNFSPSAGFAGSRFVLSSTRQLAEHLIVAPLAEDVSVRGANSFVHLQANTLKQVLADNREQLIAQNMLEEGSTQEEAEDRIELLLEAISYFRGIGMHLSQDSGSLALQLEVNVMENQ
jgi:hypothetical protein